MFRSSLAHARLCSSAAIAAALSSAVLASAASAGPGYELDPAKPSIALGAQGPRGVAIDQVSQLLYVTELTADQANGDPGQIEQFNASGIPTADSPFVTGGDDFFVGVAVNPVNQSIYAYQTQLTTPVGTRGSPLLSTFSSTGVVGSSFAPIKSTAAQLAVDASGRLYFPNDGTGTVQIFNSTGTLEGSIACTGCPGGEFDEPASIALDSAANLYVVDLANGGRAIKFNLSAGSYVYDSTLQSGAGAAAVGVDPASGDVFVGDWAEGTYHVVAYDSFGVQFDDFGGGVFASPTFGAIGAGQIAVNQTTQKVYVADSGANVVRVFRRVASIPAPTASTAAPSSKGQLGATLNAVVNPNGHGLSDCHFEYTDDADFQLNGFTAATSIPCFAKPIGSSGSTASASVSGLTPETTYDYRIVVTSNGGTAKGTAQAFETLPPLPPDVTTGSALVITQTSATIGGTVNPKGGPISDCHFEYTDDADFQLNGFTAATSKACLAKPSGTANASVSAKLTGLTADTDYRFRVVATNNSGKSEATAKAFATLADTCATNPAVCPPPEEKPPVTPPPVTLPAQPPVITPPATPPAKPLKCRKGFKKKQVRGKPKCVKIKKKRATRKRHS